MTDSDEYKDLGGDFAWVRMVEFIVWQDLHIK